MTLKDNEVTPEVQCGVPEFIFDTAVAVERAVAAERAACAAICRKVGKSHECTDGAAMEAAEQIMRRGKE